MAVTEKRVTGSAGVGARELVVLLSSVMALMAVGIDLMLPALDDIGEAFGLAEGSSRTGQIITFYFFGMAVAQLVYGPLADRIGRKPVLYGAVVIYVLGAIASALAPSFELLLAARVFWGTGAAGARVVATSIIRDRFVGDEMARVMSQIMAVFVIVPVFAPLLGGAIVAVVPWQGLFWFCAIWALVVAAWSLRLDETLDPAHVRDFSLRQALRSYAEVARNREAASYTLATIFIQGAFTTYLASSEQIIGDIFGYEDRFEIIFGVIAIGFGVSATINGRLVERHGIHAMVWSGFACAIVLSAIAAALALAADGEPNIWIFMPIVGLSLSCFMLIMPNLNTAAMVPLGHIAGSASAFISAARIGLGSALAAFVIGRITDSVTPFALMLLAMCVLAAASTALVSRPGSRSATP